MPALLLFRRARHEPNTTIYGGRPANDATNGERIRTALISVSLQITVLSQPIVSSYIVRWGVSEDRTDWSIGSAVGLMHGNVFFFFFSNTGDEVTYPSKLGKFLSNEMRKRHLSEL